MFVGVLGPLEVDGQPVDALGPRERRVLATLALTPGIPVNGGRLQSHLWEGDAPPTARKVIQQCVSNLRKQLGGDCIRTTSDGYVLTLDSDGVDACIFEAEMTQARLLTGEGKPWAAADTLTAALALWRGDALVDLRGSDAGSAAGRRLDEQRLQAEEDLAEARLACGEHAAVVGQLREAVEAQPLRERRWAQLMLALYRCRRQAEALRAYQELSDLLGEQLGVEPSSELSSLEESILIGSADLDLSGEGLRTPVASGRSSGGPPHGLPRGLNSFIGRRDEIDAIEESLDAAPLITIVGPGGCGKTRLALEIGAHLVTAGQQVWLVDLAPLRGDGQVASAIAQTLGIRESPQRPLVESIAVAIEGRSVTLIVDNCEHVIQSAAEVIEALLVSCPQLRVLATSREPLTAPGEQIYRLAPLPIPSENDRDMATLGAFESVQLLVERAKAQNAAFALTPSTSRAVIEICTRLDGIPLAIELAAARLRSMSIDDIASRLADRFTFLTSGARTARTRQRTLEATIGWSFDLLTPDERTLLRRLSVFVAPFTLEAAEAVGGDSIDALGRTANLVASLADKSLLEPRLTRGGARYHLLESVREYAAHELHELEGAASLASDRHATYFSLRWSDYDPMDPLAPVATRQSMWERFQEEKPDLLIALAHLSGDASRTSRAVVLGVAIGAGLFAQGDYRHLDEIARALESRLDEVGDQKVRTQLLSLSARGAYYRGDVDGFFRTERLALLECDRSGAELEEATILYRMSSLASLSQPEGDAPPMREEVLQRCTSLVETGVEPAAVALARSVRALVRCNMDGQDSKSERQGIRADFQGALEYLDSGEPSVTSWVVRQAFGSFEMSEGHLAQARVLTQRCMEELDDFSPIGRRVSVLVTLALIDALDSQTGRAAQACASAADLVLEAGLTVFFSLVVLTAGVILQAGGAPEIAARAYGAVTNLLGQGTAPLEQFEMRLLEEGRATLCDSLGSGEYEELESEYAAASFGELVSLIMPALMETGGSREETDSVETIEDGRDRF